MPHGTYAVQNDCLRFGKLLVCGSRGWTTPENGTFTPEDKKIYDRELIRLRLSLDDAMKKREEGDKIVLMTHYPPFNSKFDPSPFTDLIGSYPVDSVVYGHLHGKNVRVRKIVTVGGIPYYLTSCDMIANTPVLIMEI